MSLGSQAGSPASASAIPAAIAPSLQSSTACTPSSASTNSCCCAICTGAWECCPLSKPTLEAPFGIQAPLIWNRKKATSQNHLQEHAHDLFTTATLHCLCLTPVLLCSIALRNVVRDFERLCKRRLLFIGLHLSNDVRLRW